MSYNACAKHRLRYEDLAGCAAVLYDRWSSIPQGRGSTKDRQTATRLRIIGEYALVPDPRYDYTDAGFSASKGHHKSKGKFGKLLALAEAGAFFGSRPVVLVAEATNRMFREGVLNGIDDIRTLIRGNLVIITGDGSIWSHATLEGPENHKLIAELNAAKLYAADLHEWASGAHTKRRKAVMAVLQETNAPRPKLNGRAPFWLDDLHDQQRPGPDGFWYEFNDHVETVQRIYCECSEGRTAKQIATGLNRDGVPMPSGGVWRASRIGAILRDRHVLGMYRPIQHLDGKRVAVGPEVVMFPPAVEAKIWFAARCVLENRERRVRGRKGIGVSNLFTGRAVCPTCEGKLRIDTGGGIRNGRRKRHLICSAYMQSATCSDKTRYDMHYFERHILYAIVNLSEIAPSAPTADASSFKAERAKLMARGEWVERELARLDGPAESREEEEFNRRERRRLGIEQIKLEKQIGDVDQQIGMVATSEERGKEKMRFLRDLAHPAARGDIDAREQMRSLLAGIDFWIVGDGSGGMWLKVGEQSAHISPEGRDEDVTQDESHLTGEEIADGILAVA
jgi:hypothetical protein